MDDWATTTAREWLESLGGRLEGPGPIGEAYGWLEVSDENAASLAALLREVAENAHDDICAKMARAERSALLAEVRRVVEQTASDVRLACISTSESDVVGALRGALLSRLDKL